MRVTLDISLKCSIILTIDASSSETGVVATIILWHMTFYCIVVKARVQLLMHF